jgi:hypothetical protein
MKIQLKNEHNSEAEDLVQDPENDQQKPKNRISISRILIMLCLTLMGFGMFFSYEYLTNPLSPLLLWLPFYQTPAPPNQNLYPPQTLSEITKELTELQLKLGERLEVDLDDLYIYPVLGKTKEIEEIRIYQTITEDLAKGKLRLVQKFEVLPLDEHYVKAIELRYSKELAKVKPTGKKMPLTRLQTIPGNSPSQGLWFMSVGSKGDTNYGQIFCYVSAPQPDLNVLTDWVIPGKRLPEWRDISEVPQEAVDIAKNQKTKPSSNFNVSLLPNEPELVIDQTQFFEPDIQVFKLQPATSLDNPLQLRQITLNEAPKFPKIYGDALLLASGGLWSPAIAKLEQFKSELQTKGKTLPPFIQEQYELIAAHAKITAEQADRTVSDSGQQALVLILDGRWKEALKIAEASDYAARSVAEMMITDNYHVWPRVKAALRAQPGLEVKIWGALVFLQRKGLPEATQWLAAQKAYTDSAIALLQKSDISPLKIKPKQFLGSLTALGKGAPGKNWQIKFSDLPPGQEWYRIDVSVIKDDNNWINGAFPEIARRSPLLIWEALGLESNNFLTATITTNNGIRETSSLTAKSLWIGADGSLQILATGYESLSKSISESQAQNDLAPIVTSDNIFTNTINSSIYIQTLDPEIEEKITKAVYSELQKIGQISLEFEDFKRQLALWSFQSADITGDKQPDFILEIERSQIDAGDRIYPLRLVFDSNGNILFSDIASSDRRWVTILPGNNSGQILTEIGGRYEVWSLR